MTKPPPSFETIEENLGATISRGKTYRLCGMRDSVSKGSRVSGFATFSSITEVDPAVAAKSHSTDEQVS